MVRGPCQILFSCFTMIVSFSRANNNNNNNNNKYPVELIEQSQNFESWMKKKVFKKVFSKNVFFAARRRFRFGWNELGPKKTDRLKLKKKIGAKFVFRKKLFSADQKFVQNHILGFFFHLTAWNFNFSTDPCSSTQPPTANNPAQSPVVPIRDV